MTKESRDVFVVLEDGEYFVTQNHEMPAQLIAAASPHHTYVRATVSWEKPVPVPRFKAGDRIVFSESATSGVAAVERVDNSVYKIRLPDGGVNYWNIGRIDASYELAPAEPKFKEGDRIRRGPDSITVTVFAATGSVYTLERKDGTRFLDNVAGVDGEYELAPPEPKFKVGQTISQKVHGYTRPVEGFEDGYYDLGASDSGAEAVRINQESVEFAYELVPVPSFEVGEMVLDLVMRQYAQIDFATVTGKGYAVGYGDGSGATRHTHELQKVSE